MPSITLKNVTNFACRNVNLEIKDKEFLVVLGPNGSGKTTLLNVISGLIEYQGTVLLDGIPLDRTPTNKRKVGYLFQNLVLFPHMDVFNNVAYSLSVKKWPRQQIQERVKESLSLLNINHLSSRYPRNLSGGEKQRVALARALAMSPEVLLLDEPLSSMDTQTAKYLRVELKQIQKKLGITTVYVTHNFDEAEEMADRIAILSSGNLEQVGKPYEIFFYPQNKQVSEFIGTPNILECDYCHEVGTGVMEVGCGGLPIIVPHDGKTVHRIALFPRDIYVSDFNPPGPQINRFRGIVTAVNVTQDMVRINISAGKNDLLSEMPRDMFDNLDISINKEVFLIFRLRKIRIYENTNL